MSDLTLGKVLLLEQPESNAEPLKNLRDEI